MIPATGLVGKGFMSLGFPRRGNKADRPGGAFLVGKNPLAKANAGSIVAWMKDEFALSGLEETHKAWDLGVKKEKKKSLMYFLWNWEFSNNQFTVSYD